MIIIIEAINKIHQSTVNRMYIAERKYNDLVDATSRLEDVSTFPDLDDDKAWTKSMRKQEDMWCLFMNYFNDLPKREQANAERKYKAIHGYSCV